MAIVKRGENVYLVRVYLGRDRVTKKRLQKNVTIHGTLEDAERQEQLLKQKAVKGELSISKIRTVGQLMPAYLSSSRHHLDITTRNFMKRSWDLYFMPYIGSFKIEEMTTDDIQNFLNFLLDSKREVVRSSKSEHYGLGLATTTVRRLRGMLSTAFSHAVALRLINENPVKGTKIPRSPLSSANPFTLEEVWAVVSVKDHFYYGDAFLFQLQTGLRPEELMALIWDDIDFSDGTLRIERACKWINSSFRGFGKVKSIRSARVIELAPEQLDFLKDRLDKQRGKAAEAKRAGTAYGEPEMEEWLRRERSNQRHMYSNTKLIFPTSEGRVPSMSAPRGNFKSILRRAGFSGSRLRLRWYDLRHTHATYLLTLGIPDHEVAARLGHTVQMLNDTYAHVLPARQRRASRLITSLIPINAVDKPSKEEILSRVKRLSTETKEELEAALMRFFKKGEE